MSSEEADEVKETIPKEISGKPSFKKKSFSIDIPTDGKMGFSMAMIGSSRSGKTTFLKYIYKQHFKKHITTLFSQNPHAEIYSNFGKHVVVSDVYHPEMLAEAHEINKHSDNKYPFLFINDDYVDHKIKNDPEITRALTIYRNANISSIHSFQGSTLMSAVGRSQLNYIAIFKQQTPAQFERVIREFLSMWLPQHMTMREMIAFVMAATRDHRFFFIDQIESVCYISKLTKEQISD
jgi:hypothetical protein